MTDYIPLSTLNDFIFCPYSIYLHNVYMESDEGYDISNDKMRTNFAKMLKSNGAIRLQYSVYEVRNTKRIVDNLMIKIKAYSKHFTPDDSVVVFDVAPDKLTKYGNAIHRDQSVVYF